MKSDPARRESLDIAGCSISAVVGGNRNNPAVLLLHGFPSSSRTFRNIIPRLSEACFVIAPDLPGSGQSGLIPDATFARFADLVEGLLQELGVAKAHLYLHDFGAPVAFELAMRNPDSVLGLIVQNANAHRTGMTPTSTAPRSSRGCRTCRAWKRMCWMARTCSSKPTRGIARS